LILVERTVTRPPHHTGDDQGHAGAGLIPGPGRPSHEKGASVDKRPLFIESGSASDSEQLPVPGDALEFMLTSVLKFDARSGDQHRNSP